MMICPGCGATFVSRRPGRQRYCSVACANRANVAERAMANRGPRRPPPGCLSVEQVAERLGYSPDWLRHKARRLGLPLIKERNALWVRVVDLPTYEAAR